MDLARNQPISAIRSTRVGRGPAGMDDARPAAPRPLHAPRLLRSSGGCATIGETLAILPAHALRPARLIQPEEDAVQPRRPDPGVPPPRPLLHARPSAHERGDARREGPADLAGEAPARRGRSPPQAGAAGAIGEQPALHAAVPGAAPARAGALHLVWRQAPRPGQGVHGGPPREAWPEGDVGHARIDGERSRERADRAAARGEARLPRAAGAGP